MSPTRLISSRIVCWFTCFGHLAVGSTSIYRLRRGYSLMTLNTQVWPSVWVVNPQHWVKSLTFLITQLIIVKLVLKFFSHNLRLNSSKWDHGSVHLLGFYINFIYLYMYTHNYCWLVCYTSDLLSFSSSVGSFTRIQCIMAILISLVWVVHSKQICTNQ